MAWTTQVFTFGYYGWGNHTPQLVKAVDAVETGQGFKPPVFVDIRIRRSVRAAGFTGPAFERLVGQDRHRWMKSLGNKFIESGIGPTIQISDPTAVNELLDLAVDLAQSKQRVLFFCSCQWPKMDAKIHCHRATVAELVMEAARQRSVPIEVVEWPGGEPRDIDVQVSPQIFASVRRGRMTIPLGKNPDLAEFAGLPWCSIAKLHSNADILHRVVGPAISQTTGWAIPILSRCSDPVMDKKSCQREAKKLRENWGLEPMMC